MSTILQFIYFILQNFLFFYPAFWMAHLTNLYVKQEPLTFEAVQGPAVFNLSMLPAGTSLCVYYWF